ncbi:uncharacterized protein LOC135169132 [Diachasmimorpha longicaudata]|uniref:uncharacterized protein LOC135169132 n=1 Tax=Diachasmimorpha longicaudata TaxID=58733 RepID=UPI0030B8E990
MTRIDKPERLDPFGEIWGLEKRRGRTVLPRSIFRTENPESTRTKNNILEYSNNRRKKIPRRNTYAIHILSDPFCAQARDAEQKVETLRTNLKKFLNDDQILFMQCDGPTSNTRHWSEETLRKAVRILCQPGVTRDIIEWLGEKVAQDETPIPRLCVLSFDEMAIHPAVEPDRGLKKFIGLVTPELARDETEGAPQASHALAVVARRVSSHWKQPVSYALTGASIDAKKLWNYLMQIIQLLADAGLHVVRLSSDSGPGNQELWNSQGVHCIQNQGIPSCPHPLQEGERLWMAPDREHLLKNMWCQLERTDFYIPAEIKLANNLPGMIISMQHVARLQIEGGTFAAWKIQQNECQACSTENQRFLQQRKPQGGSFFKSMNGTQLCLGDIRVKPSGTTPGQGKCPQFSLLVFNHLWIFLSVSVEEKEYDRRKKLTEFVELVKALTFSKPPQRKPIQRGIEMSTLATLQFHEQYALTGKMEFFLPSRFGSTPCENLFSQARAGDMHPRPVSKNSSYADDDEAYYVDCLRGRNRESKLVEEENGAMTNLALEACQLSTTQQYGVYFLAGWIARKLHGSCEECNTALAAPGIDTSLPYQWTEEISRGGLIHPTRQLHEITLISESLMQNAGTRVLQAPNVLECLATAINEQIPPELSLCFCSKHDLVKMCIHKFLDLRVHVLALNMSQPEVVVEYASRSGFMRTSEQSAGKRTNSPT